MPWNRIQPRLSLGLSVLRPVMQVYFSRLLERPFVATLERLCVAVGCSKRLRHTRSRITIARSLQLLLWLWEPHTYICSLRALLLFWPVYANLCSWLTNWSLNYYGGIFPFYKQLCIGIPCIKLVTHVFCLRGTLFPSNFCWNHGWYTPPFHFLVHFTCQAVVALGVPLPFLSRRLAPYPSVGAYRLW